MKYMMAACPLTKLFLDQKSLVNPNTGKAESWQERCMEDFTLIENADIPFSFEVPCADGAYKLEYNVPQMIMPTVNCPEDAIFENLAGGIDGMRAPEYDLYGIAYYEIDQSVVQKMHEIAMLQVTQSGKKDIDAKIAKMTQDIQKVTKVARDKAIAISHRKVERFIKRNHVMLTKQWAQNAERGGGNYRPSDTERLGAIAIKDLIQKAQQKERNAMTEFNKIMEQTSGKGF
jgi:hypothetical protein